MRLWEALLSALYPVPCVGCDEPGARWICDRCERNWPGPFDEACAGCGWPGEGPHVCPASPEGFQGAVAAAVHRGVARGAVHAFKYRGRRGLAEVLAAKVDGAMLLGRFPAAAALGGEWLVVPAPLHPRRRKERGYDQAGLLARAIARRRGWRHHDALRRVKATDASPGLDREARRRNLAGAFTARGPLAGARVLLVDDVLTTGATLDAAARALRAAGAVDVRVAVVARTL